MSKALITALSVLFLTTQQVFPLVIQTNCEPIGFKQSPQFRVPEEPRDLASADFDGDGLVDLAVAFSFANQGFSVLRKTGTQEFGERFDFQIPSSVSTVSSVHVADLNSDGKPDVVVSSYLGNKVSIFPNISSGSNNIAFGVRSDYSTGGDYTHSTLLEDFDGDGRIDIVVGTRSTQSRVSVFRNAGSGQDINFALRQDFPMAAGGVNQMAAGDFDGDSKKDIAVGSFVSGPVYILRNTSSSSGDISFTSAPNLPISGTPGDIIAKDLNGDSRPDIAITVSGSTDRISVFPNLSSDSGAISFGQSQDFGPVDRGGLLNSADLTGDGRPELIHVNSNLNSVTLMRNDTQPSGNFSFAPIPWFFGTGLAPNGSLTGDFNSDGKVDIITTNRGSRSVSMLVNQGTAESLDFLARKDYPAFLNKNITSISAGDFDGDGDTDLAASSQNSNHFSIYRNDGTGHFSSRSEFNPLVSGVSGVITDSLTSGDFDGDGKPDIAVNGRWFDNLGNESSGVRLYRNTTNGNILAFELSSYAYQSAVLGNFLFDRIFSADFNGDGKLDLFATKSSITETGLILRNTSANAGVISFNFDGSVPLQRDRSIMLEDVDRDERIDIVHPFNFVIRALINSSAQAGSVTFVQREIPIPSSSFDLAMMADIDGNQTKDFIGVGQDLEIVLNTSFPGTFSVGPVFRYPDKNVGRGSSADFDGDGRVDLQFSRSLGYLFAEAYTNTSSGGAISLSQGIEIPYGGKGNVSPSRTNFLVEDLNLDGKADIISGTNSSYGLVSVLIGSPCSVPTFASVSGRVTTPAGIALRNATVTLIDSSGGRRQATTSSFGLYQFDNVALGLSYTISVASKRYRFPSRQILITDDVAGLDFIGLE